MLKHKKGLDDYLDKSGKAMLATTLTFDNARSTEKMSEWHCIGEDNIAWKEGPYLSAGANMKQIDRNQPYCLRVSKEFNLVLGIILGPNPQESDNGGVLVPLPPKDKKESRVEPIIAKLAIIEQFEYFKEFILAFNGPINPQQFKKWEGKVEMETLNLVNEIRERRNVLTHDSDYVLPTMMEAVEYFYQLRQIAEILYNAYLIN